MTPDLLRLTWQCGANNNTLGIHLVAGLGSLTGPSAESFFAGALRVAVGVGSSTANRQTTKGGTRRAVGCGVSVTGDFADPAKFPAEPLRQVRLKREDYFSKTSGTFRPISTF